MGLIRIHPQEDVPLWVDEEHGVIRIPGTRLKLETVITLYYQGVTDPEEIVDSFDTLTVESVTRILEWYQTRREEVDDYMEWSRRMDELAWEEIAPQIAAFKRRKEENRIKQPQSVQGLAP